MARIGAIPGYTDMFRHVPTHPARSHEPPNLLHLQQHLQAAWLDPDLAGEFPCVASGYLIELQDGAPVRARVNRWFMFVAEKTMVYGRYI